MGWGLDLVVDGKVVDSVRLSYSRHFETEVLDKVFPKKYWSGWNPESESWFTATAEAKDEPPVFDFIANEEVAKEAMREYLDNTADFADSKDLVPEWEQIFWRVYKTGMALQNQGKEPRVSIG